MDVPVESWEVIINGEPYQADTDTLRVWIADGRVIARDRVRKGTLAWIEVWRVPAFRDAFPDEGPAAAPPYAPPVPPRRCPACGRSDGYDARAGRCAACDGAVEPPRRRSLLRLPIALQVAFVGAVVLFLLFFFRLTLDTMNYTRTGITDEASIWKLFYAGCVVTGVVLFYVLVRVVSSLLQGPPRR